MVRFLSGLGLAAYRGIGPEMQFIGPFSRLNIFIGENNSGKSIPLNFISRYLPRGSQSTSSSIPETDEEIFNKVSHCLRSRKEGSASPNHSDISTPSIVNEEQLGIPLSNESVCKTPTTRPVRRPAFLLPACFGNDLLDKDCIARPHMVRTNSISSLETIEPLWTRIIGDPGPSPSPSLFE